VQTMAKVYLLLSSEDAERVEALLSIPKPESPDDQLRQQLEVSVEMTRILGARQWTQLRERLNKGGRLEIVVEG
jgi:hypothetical protein